jgi:hypothetical protein
LTDGFRGEGGVNLGGVKIDGDLGCDAGHFVGHDIALNATSCKIDGSVFLCRCFNPEGRVVFLGGYVGRKFQLSDVKSPDKLLLDLQGARVRTLLISPNSWPIPGHLFVDGLVYDEMNYPTKVQLKWLKLQDGFFPQPFEQLASLLARKGSEEEARAVMIAKNEEHARYVQWRPEWLWYGPIGWLIGYGYDPWRAFWISVGLIVIGWVVFRRAYNRGLITPTEETSYIIWNYSVEPVSQFYPKFNAFVYSLETFVPLVKLGIADRWEPNGYKYFVKRGWPKTG